MGFYQLYKEAERRHKEFLEKLTLEQKEIRHAALVEQIKIQGRKFKEKFEKLTSKQEG